MMDKYENLKIVGEGSYGLVMKCRHKETGQFVAIKKFIEPIENVNMRKLVFREIRMLKRLRHENLVSLIEAFRRKKRFYLVFEYLDHTILDELESIENGLGFENSRRHIFQVLRGLNYCHSNNIIHRDVKPENVLVSNRGIVKLCDFGFARIVTGANESCTEYVATRWYRAPELLIGDLRYGPPVDTWAAGCLFAEMLTGEPLFPGDSDLDQIFRITKTLGGLCPRHLGMANRSSKARVLFKMNITGSWSGARRTLRALFPGCGSVVLDFLLECLRMDPEMRSNCSSLLNHAMFHQESFAEKFMIELGELVAKEARHKPLMREHYEERRKVSVMSIDEPQRNYPGNCRWQIKLISEKPLDNQGRSRGQTQGDQRYLNNSREIYFPGPVNLATNSSYAHRLEQGPSFFSTSETKSDKGRFVLPALDIRKSQHQRHKTSTRPKLKLPSSKKT